MHSPITAKFRGYSFLLVTVKQYKNEIESSVIEIV